MDLSLRGSQINLATRDKASVGANSAGANINVVEKATKFSGRPQSACIRKKSSLLRQQTNCKRPLSADNKYDVNLNNPLKRKSNLDENKKKYASSTNLLKLLSAEPQTNWMPTDSDLQSESSTSEQLYSRPRHHIHHHQQLQRHNNHQMLNNVSFSDKVNHYKVNLTSVDKHSSPDSSAHEAEQITNLQSMNDVVNSSTPKSTPDLKEMDAPKMNNITSKGILKLDTTRNDELKSNIRKHQSYESWISENIKSKNLDLPGRVSFSTNNVYEIEYSDYDDTDKSIESPKSSVPKPLNNRNEPYKPCQELLLDRNNDTDDTHSDETDDVCCASRCNKLYDSSAAKARMETKAEAEANKIVEEYKREIAELKRIHLKNPYSSPIVAMAKTKDNYFGDSTTPDDGTSPSDLRAGEAASNKSYESLYQKLSTIEDMSDISEIPKTTMNDVSPPPLPIKLNNIWDKENKLNIVSAGRNVPSCSSVASSTTPIIKNYLSKTKNENSTRTKHKTRHSDTVKKTTTTTGNTTTTKGKLKSAMRVKSAPAASNINKMRKSKSIPSLREDRNIDEFEIDKVVSWMSIHDDFSDTASVNNVDGSVGGGGGAGILMKNDAMRWKLPSSSSSSSAVNTNMLASSKRMTKVDDEGNFSIEEGHDTDSPYEEIVSVIKEIENDKRSKGGGGAMKSLKADVEFKLNTLLSNIESPDSAISDDEKIDTKKDKVNQILHYLDEVDSRCDKTMESIKNNSEKDTMDVEYIFEPDYTEDIPKVSELLMLTNHQLCRKIVNLSLRVNELNNAIQLSKEHVSNVRAEKMKTVRLEKQNTQKRLNEQKKHYEDIVQRHQNFIEQLLKDKTNLCEKVNQLTRRIDSQNQAWEHRLKTEVERAKETVVAGEKIRREKWVRDNTKKIKELTVKGLEMEVTKMQTNHQKEVAELKRVHQKELLDVADEAKMKYDEKEKEIRDSYAKDREGAIEKERLAILARFEKQIEDERKMFEQQKQRLIKEVEEEKERIYRDQQNQKTQYDASREKLKTESMDLLHHVKQEFREKLKQRETKHQNELKKLEEQFESDFAVWKREYETTMKLREVERENYIRQQSRIERDRQIDSIVAKVDAEALKNQQEHEMKISRVKEKYEREIKDLERQETDAKEKYIESKTRLGECEANITNLQATVKQLETQLTHFKKMCDDFIKEKETIKSDAKKEVQHEVKTAQKERDAEIQRIYARVQKAIEKKDSTLEAVQKENAKLKERCLKLDAIVKQQRKDYCTK